MTRGQRRHRILFDAGVTPDGLVENMRRLGLAPGDIEVIVLSHGHSDHTTGLDGLIRALGRTNLPVLIHPEFWSRRRIVTPGRDPVELATTSRRALEGAGFVVVEDRQPSFLFEGSVLVTGEVDRTTGFERGLATHQAWRQGHWQPDPLILDDQALVLCDALAAFAPQVLVPAHCTGWRAVHTLAARFPDAFIQTSVGTSFEL